MENSHFSLLNLLYSYQGPFYNVFDNDQATRQKFKTQPFTYFLHVK